MTHYFSLEGLVLLSLPVWIISVMTALLFLRADRRRNLALIWLGGILASSAPLIFITIYANDDEMGFGVLICGGVTLCICIFWSILFAIRLARSASGE